MESRIDHAYLLFFPSGSSIVNISPIAAVRADVDENDPGILTFNMPLALQPDTDYSLIAVANADGFLPQGYSGFSDYLSVWCSALDEGREELQLFHFDPILAGKVEYLPMRGKLVNDTMFRFTMHDGVYQVSASLSFRRLVARIDVANIVKDGFTVEGAALCNWRDGVSMTSDSQIGSVRGVLSEQGENQEDIEFIDLEDISGFQQLQSSIYSFPSSVAESSLGDKESTAIIIKAKYGDDTESTYYRVNIGVNAKGAEVKPNTKYLITIQSVKGRGASTPEEAYSSTESRLTLSVVTDWDIDGGCAMDDFGNFIIVSRGTVEFDADPEENKEVKVLASKGMNWDVEYIPTDEASKNTFIVNKVSSSIIISPKDKNATDSPFSGVCRVSAITPQGNVLTVDITIIQNNDDVPVGPVIPWDQPFALVPIDNERVKIDHDAKTIEIDGFDPDCFNSFIDIPFQVYINESEKDLSSISMSSTLLWPLEGRISIDHSSQYNYCIASFAPQGSGKVVDKSGTEVSYTTLWKKSISGSKDGLIYMGIGAMGPDDPPIIRSITLSGNGKQISYELTVKPRPIIIDDVILSNDFGEHWLVQDRNVQNLNNSSFVDYIGLDSNGKKYQAYNYSSLSYLNNLNYSNCIPFKLKSKDEVFNEEFHSLYAGRNYSMKIAATLSSKSGAEDERKRWLRKYIHTVDAGNAKFYKYEKYLSWIIGDNTVREV
ncbi:MAG: hypothetical protein K2M16_09565, partial [Muribaculaceae bacterium]|nr:hypothetical protein [Muribaculaceae bacterium]